MSERLVTFVKLTCLVAGLGAVVPGHAQTADPFRTPNLSPPVAVVGLPVWAAVPQSTRVGLTTELANHYRVSERLDDKLILDGETLRLRAYYERPIGSNWSLGFDLPVYHQSGGILDDVVDAWHSAFRLPDGDRNRRPEGVLEFDLADSSGTFFALNESDTGLGDIQLSAARSFGDGGWTLRATVELPTGSERILAGSGSTDWNIALLRSVEGRVRGRAAGYFFGAAVLDYEQPDRIAFPVEGEAVAAVLGGGIALGQRFGIKGQIDANSALYDTRLEEIGQTAVQATIGGWLQFGDAARLEMAVTEDLHVSTTPDVVIYFDLNWNLQ